MNSQKIDNLLNLAFDSTQEERKKSLNLNVGYQADVDMWDVIVKYSGDSNELKIEGVEVVKLLNEYAIVTLAEEKIIELSSIGGVEYIEKPKRLYFERIIGRQNSGLFEFQKEDYGLLGEGCIIAILDSGIDYRNDEFRNADGSTRIVNLWDQTIQENPPEGYNLGTEYTKSQINQALAQPVTIFENSVVPSTDVTGHGTAVAGIATGTNGVAPKADIIVVKLGVPQQGGFPRTIELMEAINYVVEKALNYGKPLAINISIGNTYGSHTGSSLLERFIDDIANYWKTVICIGAGNEGNVAGHVRGRMKDSMETVVELAVERNQTAISVQVWKFFEDIVEISLITPSGDRIGPISETIGVQRYMTKETELLLYYGKPTPSSIEQEIYIEFLPIENFIQEGLWKIVLTPVRLVTGDYNLWLPSYSVLNAGTNFLNPSEVQTLTIPSTASRVITVGAYDAKTFTYASFSGRGELETPLLVKPDIVAPGVDIRTVGLNGNEVVVSGTSFATPFVTGVAALLMEWGIVRENDEYLYGEKLKAYLRRSATTLPGEDKVPNNRIGYGRLKMRLPKEW